MPDCLNSTRTGDVALLTLNRPERRNALNIELCNAIREAATDAADAGVRAIVVTGEGSSFCSGADLSGVYGQAFIDALYGMLHGLSQLPVPLIAAVNGPAIGGGAQLAIACDLRVASAAAQFAVPTPRNALATDAWTIRTLADIAGHGVARRLLLAAETFDAEAALAAGLADRQGDSADALAWAAEIATFAPLTLAYNKRVLNGWAAPDELDQRYADIWASQDAKEAAAAWVEKRLPRFSGR
ncbi:enoyl-CoA hydratase [Propionicimonas sp.]|uniref:enoyl-CoA hydratase n=1 Tax=Propionicimonas sp. TaxID=1955623 RepID=UPI001810D34B|nr:enoyl-CoA hydratase [Propionicimonas sp.]MBU3976085.1 enoyl-CoA hydratase [Actinomycetota bacterium]MBA3020898.1 enoyl-CoA hydratase [Propionicimonas sp.]MBU3985275.1 enoyl-CoA hydratase [Actinomycetota bacterium]MBU4008265.1 enoyl-CoA hydratase [Actinomycetota bacterium]MBU4064521.1 enoyl-CoA hydratase [Actinomycetota bacterium]